jgi:glutamate dehydrogenase (NAD(P)+)
VVLQGLGNVGYHAARFLEEAGAILVGIVEYEGAIHNPQGIDLTKLWDYRKNKGSMLDFPGSTNLASREEGLEIDCDILVPAALENQITRENAGRIKAKIIVEGANGPITSDASEMLSDRGVLVLPDHFVNAGGVLVSYFEWLKNLRHVRLGRMEKRFEEQAFRRILGAIEGATDKVFGEQELASLTHGADEADLVNSGLEDTFVNAYQRLREIRNQHRDKADLRTAAFVDAIEKIAICYSDLGIFP